MMTLKKFVDKNDLHLKLYKLPFRVDIEPGTFDEQANHYSFIITRPYTTEKLRGCYSQGSGIKHPPTVEDILNSLILDTLNIESSSFQLFCDDFGYSSDSIKASKVYKYCLEELEKLKKFFTPEQLKVAYSCEQL